MGASTCTQRKENPSTGIFNSPEWKEQVESEKKTQPDIVGCRTEFLDMTENDFPTALVLNDIYFWHLPPKEDTENKGTKLGILRDGTYWLARKNSDWGHLRLNERQIRLDLKKLKEKGWIDTKVSCINKTSEKHVLIRLTEKFAQIRAKNKKEQMTKLSDVQENKRQNCRMIGEQTTKLSDGGGANDKNVISIYTDSFVSDSFEEQILGKCVSESIELRKDIGEKAKQVLLSWEQMHNPVALLKGYENLWAEYLEFTSKEPTLVVETEVGRLITYCHLLGMVHTPETRKRLEAIWNHFECDKITYPYGGAERSIFLILLFVLRQKAPGWLPSDIESENLDSVLWALLAYYEKHHEELEFPA